MKSGEQAVIAKGKEGLPFLLIIIANINSY